METLNEFLDQVTRQYGSRPALLYHPREVTEVWTYTQLRERSLRVAAWLQAQGIAKGDRIIICAPNSPWWAAAYFGVLRAGAILVPIDVRSTADFVERAVHQTSPKLALLAAGTRNLWPYPIPSALLEEFATLPEPATPVSGPPIDAGDIVELMFTSGTTGDPKGVIITHRNILANLESSEPLVPNIPEFRMVSILPLSHMLEQTIGLLLALKRGASIYYLSGMQPATLFATFKEHRPTTLLLVPQVLHLLMDGIEREVQKQGKTAMWARLQMVAARLPLGARRLLFRQVLERLGGKIAFLTSGGAPLTPEMIHKWELLGIPIVQGYGTTEASPVISATSLKEHLPASVGKAVRDVEIRIAADGEVLLRGPNITSGYWQNPELTRQAFDDGWYKTGDLGRLDAQGHLYLHGRKKDMIVLANGENVYPEDVEGVLRQIPGVVDAAVLGMPTPQGAAVHAALLLASSTVDPRKVVQQANGQLAPRQRIQGQTVWPEADFPRTFTLKVKKHDVLSAILAERDRAPGTTPARGAPRSREEEVIARIAAAASLDPAQITPETRLADIAGLDSLAQVELLGALEAATGNRIDEAQITAETTVAELAKLLDSAALGARPLAPAASTTHLQAGAAGSASWGVRAFRMVLRSIFLVVFRVRVGGLRRVPATPTIICANHLGWTDPFLILLYFPVQPRVYVVGETTVREISSFRGWLIDKLQIMVPVDRSNPGAALRTMEDVLRRGGSLLIFPEGRLGTEEGRLQPLQAGAAEASVVTGVPLVPVGLTGTQELWLRRPLTVRIGAPIDPAGFQGDTRARAAAVTRQLAAQMQALLPGDEVHTGRKLLRNWLTRLL